MSGYQDLNLGPPAPKAGALPDCATSRESLSLSLGGSLAFFHTQTHTLTHTLQR